MENLNHSMLIKISRICNTINDSIVRGIQNKPDIKWFTEELPVFTFGIP